MTPTPFQPITIMYKGAVYAPGEREDTLPLFHLYPYSICTLWCACSMNSYNVLAIESLVSDIPAGDGKITNLFLQ